jgi:hypothetical protein
MRKIALVSSFALLGCGAGWVQNRPRQLAIGNPQLAFEAIVVTLRAGGYNTVEMDQARYYLRAASRVDGDVVGRVGAWGSVSVTARVSWISFQVYSDGQIAATANGYHVRDQGAVMSRRLAEEIDSLMYTIAQNARILASQRQMPAPQPTPALTPVPAPPSVGL